MAKFERSERAPKREMERLARQIRQLQAQVTAGIEFSRVVGEILVVQTERRFDSKRGPDEQHWKPWSARYAATRKSGDSLLIDNSTHDARYPHLKDSIRWNATSEGVTVGSEGVPYARYVQRAREYLGLSRKDLAELEAVLQNTLERMVEPSKPRKKARRK